MWIAHFLLFRSGGITAWLGTVIVVDNVVCSTVHSRFIPAQTQKAESICSFYDLAISPDEVIALIVCHEAAFLVRCRALQQFFLAQHCFIVAAIRNRSDYRAGSAFVRFFYEAP